MKKNTNLDLRKSLIRVLVIPVLILLIPFIAMQFSSEWNWDETDFIVIGVLLVGAMLIYEFASNKFGKHKLAIAIAVLLGVMYIWVELGVGIFTNWGS